MIGAALSLALAGCAPRQPPAASQAQPSPAPVPVDRSQLTGDEVNALRQKIMACWYIETWKLIRFRFDASGITQ
jgi:hypothetical protein